MRKHILSVCTLLALVLVLGSCGAQRKTSTGGASTSTGAQGPSASQWRSGLKGKWVLNSVDREDIPAAYTIKNIFDVDTHLIASLKQQPELINFSKWGIYLPFELQCALIKERLYDFEGAQVFLTNLRLLALN